jgi:hypothetical protein
MKADLKRILQFLIITTTIITVLIITFHCISMINTKYHTASVINLFVKPIMTIGFIDLLIFIPSTLIFAFVYVNKYNTENIVVNWSNDQALAYARS